jgi:PAS domain S-box-containing protein
VVQLTSLKFDKVLYVEDNKDLQKYYSEFLQKIFQEVYICSNGQEALETFKQNRSIALIITDINMPIMNGFQLLKKIRSISSDVHAIILSALDFGVYLEDINDLDILNEYLVKPVSEEKLYSAIAKTVDKIKQRKEYTKQYHLTQQYKNALDNSAVISKTDPKGVITYVNDAFCQISGYSREELLGQTHSILKDPDFSQKVYKELWITIRAKLIFKYPSLPNIAKDGTRYYVNITVLPILDVNHNIMEYISIRFDTTQLQQSLKDERKAKESQSIFLANMSHEIRTPLNAILGFTQILQNSPLPLEEKEYINTISSSADTLLHTINEILDVSKIQTGKMEIENIYFDPHKEFKTMIQLFVPKAQEKNISLKFNFPQELFKGIALEGDLIKLKQIISNLINNAIKFSSENGKVSLDISVESHTNSKIKLHFCITDNGIGIEKERQEEIFHPFVQEYQSTTRQYGGTGLGLAISKDMISLLGGKIGLQSEKNKGSRFFFSIEFGIGDAKMIPQEDTHINQHLFNATVLVAEDVALNQKLMQVIFSKKGLKTIFANDGLEAVNIFETSHQDIDIVFLDINMPIMDGIEALDKINLIKKYRKTKNIPVVALTANAISGDKEKFLSYGFDEYIAKPIQIKALSKILSRYLTPLSSNIERTNKQMQNKDGFLVKNAKDLEMPQEFYKELLSDYLKTIDTNMALLQTAIEKQQKNEISEIAHKLKGTSGNLRLNKLYESFKFIEKNPMDKDISIYIENIESSLHNLKEVMKSQ